MVSRIAPSAASALLKSGSAVLLDVRTPAEYQKRHIPGSILVPDYELEERADELLPDLAAPIVVYCQTGHRSADAADLLDELGYTAIYDLGSINAWPFGTVSSNQ